MFTDEEFTPPLDVDPLYEPRYGIFVVEIFVNVFCFVFLVGNGMRIAYI
jgi:hypothetical protein